MAMMASKADVNAAGCAGLEAEDAGADCSVKSVDEADAPRRSPAEGPSSDDGPPSPLAVLADWIWEAE